MVIDSGVQPAAAEYYSQRAFKGSFQLSEGTVVSPHGHGCAVLWFAESSVHLLHHTAVLPQK